MDRLPNMKSPCSNCPFRKDSLEGWLGEERITGILDGSSFACHKTTGGKDKELKQCAGHMIIKGNENDFVLAAKIRNMKLDLKGHGLVFDTIEDCIDHHK